MDSSAGAILEARWTPLLDPTARARAGTLEGTHRRSPGTGPTLRLDPLAATTLVLPLALDARGVGRVDPPVPSRGSFPLDELWAQALVLRTGAAPELTPARRVELR